VDQTAYGLLSDLLAIAGPRGARISGA